MEETSGTSSTEGSLTLSTGETVAIPLVTEATMVGTVLTASHARVRELLPSGLAPIRVAPGRAAMAFLCVEYHRIGDGAIEPYDEFGVIVPAVHGPIATLPRRDARGLASAFSGGAGGYVWYLPVTTEPGRALGVEGWGYPKEVASVSFEDVGSRRRTTVVVEDERLITIGIDRPDALRFDLRTGAYSYTFADEVLRRQPLSFDGEIGVWPFSDRVSYSLGAHPRAERLRELDIGRRALVRFSAEGEFSIGFGSPVAEAD